MTYSMLIKSSSKQRIQDFKRKIVMYAQREGIKPTALKFGIARNSVRAWKRSFEKQGWEGLCDKRKGPLNLPHKTSREEEKKVLKARELTGNFIEKLVTPFSRKRDGSYF